MPEGRSPAGLYILLLSIHGLIRGKNLELGRDADTGGQTTYVVELARALSAHPKVGRVDLATRQVFGATVDLADEDSDEELTYQIVGEDEADIKAGLISITSPIARALIGKEEGDVATVMAPGGERNLEIVEVRYE